MAKPTPPTLRKVAPRAFVHATSTLAAADQSLLRHALRNRALSATFSGIARTSANAGGGACGRRRHRTTATASATSHSTSAASANSRHARISLDDDVGAA